MVASRPETEWDAQQRGWMLALAEYRASRCGGCGQNVYESQTHEGTHAWRAKARRCWACDRLGRTQAQAAEQFPDVPPGARKWRVEKVR